MAAEGGCVWLYAVAANDAGTGTRMRLYPPQSPDLAGPRARMVLNAAYLIADERASEFAATIADLTTRHRSVRLVVTGPWPAYSFVGEGNFRRS